MCYHLTYFLLLKDKILSNHLKHQIQTYHQYYPYAKQCLQELSKDPNVKLILWSGCFKDAFNEYIKKFEQDGIKFDYVNENPECKNSDYACFDKKFYFDIGIDDKFGFDALNDWREFYPLIIKNK